MKIAVTNAVLSNTGDAAIFEGIVAALLKRGVTNQSDILVFDSNARVTRDLYPHWSIFQQVSVSPPREPGRLRNVLQRVRHLLVEAMRSNASLGARLLQSKALSWTAFAQSYAALASVDLVISSGGTYLVDHYDFKSRVVELSLAKSLGSDVILWTQSMGPFESTRSQNYIRQIAKVVDGVFFRDEKSKTAWTKHANSALAGEVVADAAFALAAPDDRSGTVPNSHKKAIVSVREWSRGVTQLSFETSDYFSAMREAGTALTERGWQVTALSTCQGVRGYSFDDSKLAKQIYEDTQVEINIDFHTAQELLAEVADVDLVISTRMHLAILSLIAGTPVIAIAYEFKTVELFRALGLGDLVITIEEVSTAWIRSAVDRIASDPGAYVLSDKNLLRLKESASLPAFFTRELRG